MLREHAAGKASSSSGSMRKWWCTATPSNSIKCPKFKSDTAQCMAQNKRQQGIGIPVFMWNQPLPISFLCFIWYWNCNHHTAQWDSLCEICFGFNDSLWALLALSDSGCMPGDTLYYLVMLGASGSSAIIWWWNWNFSEQQVTTMSLNIFKLFIAKEGGVNVEYFDFVCMAIDWAIRLPNDQSKAFDCHLRKGCCMIPDTGLDSMCKHTWVVRCANRLLALFSQLACFTCHHRTTCRWMMGKIDNLDSTMSLLASQTNGEALSCSWLTDG